MGIDPSIILQGQQRVQLQDPMETAQRALTMRGLMQQSQANDRALADQNALREAYNRNMTTAADGTLSLNNKAFLSDLARQNPVLAMDKQKEITANDAAARKQTREGYLADVQMKSQLLAGVPVGPNASDEQKQAGWSAMLQKSAQLGVPTDGLPQQFPGDTYVQLLSRHLQSADKQQDQFNKDREDQRKREETQTKRDQNSLMRSQQQSDRTDKMAQALDKHLSQGWSGRSGQAGQVQGKINAAEYAEGLVEQGKHQPGGLDSRQIEELAQSTARLLGGTAAASARVEALVPHTLWGQTQSLKEWLTNNPTGQDMQKFVDRMTETISREKAIAQTQQRTFQVEGLAAHSALRKRDPELYNSILKSKGIDPSMITKDGRYAAPAAKDPKDLHSMSDDEIDRLYKEAGGK